MDITNYSRVEMSACELPDAEVDEEVQGKRRECI